jgi:hypothetical protein
VLGSPISVADVSSASRFSPSLQNAVERQQLMMIQACVENACNDQQPKTCASVQDEKRKSPLSLHFEDVVDSFRDKWLRSSQIGTPLGRSFKPPALFNQAMQQDSSSSRQLDFDSENISFEISPLKFDSPGPFLIVNDLLQLALSLDRMPFSCRATIAHHVCFPELKSTMLLILFADLSTATIIPRNARCNHGNQIYCFRAVY